MLADKNDYSLKIVRFQGKDKRVMLERDEYGSQCLISEIDQVLRRLTTENTTRSILKKYIEKKLNFLI